MRNAQFAAVVWKEEGSYVSICPEAGISSVGDSHEEAVSNLTEAVRLWLENACALGMMDDMSSILNAEEKSAQIIDIAI